MTIETKFELTIGILIVVVVSLVLSLRSAGRRPTQTPAPHDVVLTAEPEVPAQTPKVQAAEPPVRKLAVVGVDGPADMVDPSRLTVLADDAEVFLARGFGSMGQTAVFFEERPVIRMDDFEQQGFVFVKLLRRIARDLAARRRHVNQLVIGVEPEDPGGGVFRDQSVVLFAFLERFDHLPALGNDILQIGNLTPQGFDFVGSAFVHKRPFF